MTEKNKVKKNIGEKGKKRIRDVLPFVVVIIAYVVLGGIAEFYLWQRSPSLGFFVGSVLLLILAAALITTYLKVSKIQEIKKNTPIFVLLGYVVIGIVVESYLFTFAPYTASTVGFVLVLLLAISFLIAWLVGTP